MFLAEAKNNSYWEDLGIFFSFRVPGLASWMTAFLFRVLKETSDRKCNLWEKPGRKEPVSQAVLTTIVSLFRFGGVGSILATFL